VDRDFSLIWASTATGWRLHQLSNGHWSTWANGNWRMTFYFEGEDAILIDYQD